MRLPLSLRQLVVLFLGVGGISLIWGSVDRNRSDRMSGAELAALVVVMGIWLLIVAWWPHFWAKRRGR